MSSKSVRPISLLALAILLPALLAFSTPAWALESADPAVREDLKSDSSGSALHSMDRWNLETSAGFGSYYTSNVDREREGQEDEEVVLSASPRIGLNRFGSTGSIELAYVPSYRAYLVRDDRSHFGHRFNTGINLGADRLSWSLTNSFSQDKERASSELTELRDLRQNQASTELSYRLTDKIHVAVVYSNRVVEFLQSDLESRSYAQHEPGGRIYYAVTDKTTVFVDGRMVITDYFRSGPYDAEGFRVSGGVRGRLTDKIRLQLQAGHRDHEYDNPNTGGWSGFFAEGTAYYAATAKIDVYVSTRIDMNESVLSNNPYYESYNVEVGLDYHLLDQLTLRTGVAYQQNVYPNSHTFTFTGVGFSGRREDDIVSVRAALAWDLNDRWQVGATYGFGMRTTTIDEIFDYIDHTASISTNLRF